MSPINSERTRSRHLAQSSHSTSSERTASEPEREREEDRTTDAGRERETCPECDGQLVADHEHGETTCSECGLVVDDEAIDRGPEWRAFDDQERDRKARVGSPTTNMMHDKGLSTTIDWRNKDAHGNALSARQRQQVERLRTWNERFRTRDSQDRTLKAGLTEINRMASAIGIPDPTRETASVIYRRALEDGLLPGRSIEGVATAAVYAAARQAGTPRSLDELAEVSRIDRVVLMRAYRYVARELGLEISPADPLEYLPRFASELDLSEDVERRARDLLDTAMGEGYASGKNPVGLAAAALYASGLLVNEKVSQEDVSAVVDVSQVTIRNHYGELLDFQGIKRPHGD